MNWLASRNYLVVTAAVLSMEFASAGVPSLKQRQDPFYIGPSSSFTFSATTDSDSSKDVAVFQGEYGWENGIAIQLLVPTIFRETNSPFVGVTDPRIGGGPNSRIETDGLFRVWGDAYDHLGFSVGIGYPFQSAEAVRKSSLASWLLQLSALGRVDFGWFALVATLTDSPTYPVKQMGAINPNYIDTSNSVSATLITRFYPTVWMSPFIGYAEFFPTSLNFSADQGQGFFNIVQVPIGRTRIVQTGAEFAPSHFPVLFTAEYAFTLTQPGTGGTSYTGRGAVRWLF